MSLTELPQAGDRICLVRNIVTQLIAGCHLVSAGRADQQHSAQAGREAGRTLVY